MARFRPRRRSSAPFSTRRHSRLRRFRNLFPRFSPLARLRGIDVLSLFRGARRERRFSTAYLPSLGQRHSLVEGLEPKMMLTAQVEFSVATASDLEGSGGNIPSLIVTGTTMAGSTINLAVTSFAGGNQDATQGQDYSLNSSVFIPAGTYNNTLFSLSGNLIIINDSVLEPDEDIDLVLIDLDGGDELSIGNANGDATLQNTHIYTILTDDDEFTGTAGDDNFLLEDIGGGLMRISNTTAGTSLDFTPPAGAGGLIVINALGGNDRIEIDRTVFDGDNGIAGDGDRSFKGKVRVFGGDGNDTIIVDANFTSTLGIDLEIFGDANDDMLLVPPTSNLGSREPATTLHSRLVISGDPLDGTNQSNVTFNSVIIDDSFDDDSTDTDGMGTADTTLPGSGDNQEAILISGSFNTLRLENSTLISDSDDIIRMAAPEPTVQVFTGNNTFRFNAANDDNELAGVAFLRNASTPQGQQLLPVDLEENRPSNTGGGGGRLEARTPQNTPITLDVRSDARSVISASATNGSVVINANGTITYSPNISFDGTDTITYTLSANGATDGPSGRLFIIVADINDPPVNSLQSQYGPILENGANNAPTMLVLSGFPLGVTDPDAVDDVDPIKVTFSVQFGTLAVDTTGHAGVTVLSGNNTSTVVIQGTEAALNPFLQDNGATPALKYMTDAVHAGNIVLTMTSEDMGANPQGTGLGVDTDTAIIIVTAINDPPVNQLNGNPVQSNSNNSIGGFQEDSGFTFLTSQGGTLSIADDADASAVLQTTVQVSNGTLNIHNTNTMTPDTTMPNGPAISGDLTSTITLTGTLAQINTALATLQYRPNTNFDGNETLVMTTNDNGNTGTGGALSDSDNVTLVVSGDNDPPVNLWNGVSFQTLGGDNEPDISVNEDTTLIFNSGNNARITISDVDAPTSSGSDPITVTLSVGHGSLKFGSTSGLSNVTNNSGTITARGTVSEINNALNNLEYLLGANSIAATQLTITTSDGGPSPDVDRVDININAINDAPVITVQNQFPDSQSLNEDSTLVFNNVNGNMITISDVDGNSVTVTLQMLNGVGRLNVAPSGAVVSGNNTSVVTISGMISQVNQALNGLAFTPNQDFYGNATLRIIANDQGNTPPPPAESTRDVLLAVNPINDAPVNLFNGTRFESLPGLNPPVSNPPVVSTPQDQALIFDAANNRLLSTSDVDVNAPEAVGANANLMTVTLTVTNGFLTLGSTSGVVDPNTMDSIAFNNASQIQFRGTLANINNAISGLRYTPNANFAGQSTLTFNTNDLGNFGNGGAQADQDTVLINVTDVNDPPSFNIAGTIVLMEPDVDTIFTGATNPPANHPVTGSAQQHLPVLQNFISMISAGAAVGTELNQNVVFNFTIVDPAGLFKTGDGADPGTPEVIAGSFNISTGNAGTNDTTADLHFEIGADKFGTAVITITATDNVPSPNGPLTSQPQTFLVIVTPKNDVPVITLPPTQTVMEDAMLTLSADAGTMTNPRTPNQIIINDDSGQEANPQNIDVQLSVLFGTLQLQSTVGLSVTGQNTNTILINGTQPAIQAALNQGLKYTPNLNFNNTRGTERLRVEVDDFGHAGGPDVNPFDPPASGVQDRWDARSDLSISVTPKNDPVILANPFPDLARPEDAPAEQIPLGTNLILGSNFFDDADKNDNPPETITVIASSSNSTLVNAQVVGANLILTYGQNQNGAATVTVTATDGETSASDTFIVTIGGINDPPIITHQDQIPDDGNNMTTVDLGNDDVTSEDVPLVFTGAKKIMVSDAEDTTLFVTLEVQNGTLKLDNPAATLSVFGDNTSSIVVSGPIVDLNNALDGMVYTPNLDFNGVDPLVITATDSFPVTSTLTVEINVGAVNDRPIANVDSFVVAEDSNANQLLVRANDSPGPANESGQTIRIVGLSDAAPNTPGFQTQRGGTIEIGPTPGQGEFVIYTPAKTDALGRIIGLNPLDQPLFGTLPPGNFYGADSFQYIIQDDGPGNPTSTLAVVAINVTPINDAPIVDVQPASQPPGPNDNPNNIQGSRTLTMPEDTMQLLSNLVFVNDDAAGAIEVRFNATRSGSKVFVDAASMEVVQAGGLTITGNNTNAVIVVGTPTAIRAAIADPDSKYTPEQDFNKNVGNGQEQLVIRAEDFGAEGGGSSLVSTGTITFDITPVDDAPTINFDPNPLRRAQVTQATNVTVPGYAGDPDPGDEGSTPKRDPGGLDEIANQDVNITGVFEDSDPNNVVSNVAINNSNGDLTFTINPNVVGNAVIGVNLQEVGGGTPLSNTVFFNISVGFNKEPIFNLVGNVPGNLVDGNPNNDGDIIVGEGTDVNFITDWLRNLFAGPADDFPVPQAIQSVSINVISGQNLFAVGGQPRLLDFMQPTGTGLVGGGQPGGGDLTFTLADNQAGTALVEIAIVDNGGQLFPEDDNRAVKTFTITVTSDNDPPSFTIPNTSHTSLEDAGIQIVNNFVTNINANEPNQNVTFSITSNSNAALFSAAPTINPGGTLTYQAAPNANGQAILTVVAMDDGGGSDTSAPQTFAISVTPVNDAPTGTFSANPVQRDPNLGLQLLLDHLMVGKGGGADEASQTITSVTVTNVSNPALFTVLPSYTQSNSDPSKYHLTFQSATNATGSATVTVSMVDNGGTANGGANTGTATFQIVIGTPSATAVVGRHVAYLGSAYDQSPGVLDFLDDPAIDSSKVALLPGQTSTFNNSTGFGQGLNGIMIDVQGLANTNPAAVASALSFRTGTTNNTSTWTALPASAVQNVAVRQLNANTHRITVAFANRAIINRWLEVRLAANATTGLAATEVHYWGNAPGNTGADLIPSITDVGGGDLQAIAQNLNFAATNLVTNRFDLNKDRFTNAFDWQVVAANLNFNALPAITPSGAAGVAGGDAAFSLTVGADSSADEGDEVISDGTSVSGGSGGAVDGRVGSTSDGDRDLAFASMDDSGEASMDDDLLDLLAGDLLS